ncbi:lycopene cyclase domain-containing protein [Haloparvum sp. PAK95]|uniref:lycopene cyclase domain-containing protein n=1 Tax=Haloparvum sp. PAK95 TaxID=3418962 RepID=UPI003D2EEC12
MSVTRHGDDIPTALRALASQIHPVFMTPPLAASWFGAVVAGEFQVSLGAVHMLAAFFAVYTAHVKDGYVDFHARGEDDDHPLTIAGCRLALVGAAVGFLAATVALGLLVGPVGALLTLPLWAIGFLHAPQLDTNVVGVTMGYPVGIALVMLGGYYVQTGTFSPAILGFAGVFLAVLSGVKIIDDETDYDYDSSIDKRTVAVLVGRARARALAQGLLALGALGVLWGAVSGLFPPAAPVAALVFLSVVLVARSAPAEVATKLLVRGTYVFLALLIVAVWYRPLAPVGLPDVTALGPYTYLATEVVFGAAALALLRYADAVRDAARTIVALYPVAYVWDWYTLEVGVFEIVTRTGVDLFGIPIEEHLFMVVVPALVIGLHETIRRPETAAAPQRASSPDHAKGAE